MTKAKRQYEDPFILITGDFNQWRIEEVLEDFMDVKEAPGHWIDRIFSNFQVFSKGQGTLPPLETDDPQAKLSDHRIAFLYASLPRLVPVQWLEYSYRYFNKGSAKLFGGWLAHHDWGDLMSEESSNGKAGIYQRDMMGALEACFPLIKMRRKSSDPPWINAAVRRKLRQRRAIYRKEGRSAKWKRLKKITEDIIRRRQANYLLSQKDALLQKEGDRNFF